MQNAYSQENNVCKLNTSVHFYRMKEATVSFPIRLPASVRDELKALAEECEVSDQDIMRLALRIGLIDLRSTGNDLPNLVKESADELGLSFAAFAKRANKTNAFLTGAQPLIVPPQTIETTEAPPIQESTIKAGGKRLKFYSPPTERQTLVAEEPPTTSPTAEDPYRQAARHFLETDQPPASSPLAPNIAPAASRPASLPPKRPGRGGS